MSLTVSQLLNYAGKGEIVIADGNNAAESAIKQAGIFHKIKEFLGFKSAKATNEATLNAIRTAIQNDAKYVSAYDSLESQLRGIKGTITIEKVKTMLSDIDKGLANRSNEDRNKAIMSAVKGRLALKGEPPFMTVLPAGLKEDFKAFYTSAIATTVAQSNGKRSIEDCVQTIENMFPDVRKSQNKERLPNGDDPVKVARDTCIDLATVISKRNGPFLDKDGNLPSKDEANTFGGKFRMLQTMIGSFSFTNAPKKLGNRDESAIKGIHDSIISAIRLSKVLIEPGDFSKVGNLGVALDTSKIQDLGRNLAQKQPTNDEISKALLDFDKQVSAEFRKISHDFDTKDPSVQKAWKNFTMAVAVAKLPSEIKSSLKTVFSQADNLLEEHPDVKDILLCMDKPLGGITILNPEDK